MALAAQLRVPYGTHARQHLDVFVPDGGQDLALVVCLHGGWFAQGRGEDLRATCLALAEHGIPSATLDCRPLGDGPRNGQEMLDELAAGAARALEEAALLGLDGRSVLTLGSGSGSLLSLLLAARLGADPALRVRGSAACGVTASLDHADGIAQTLLRTVDQFAGGHHHALSPLHLEAAAFPPLLLLHGDADTDVPAKQAQRFHQRQVDAGEESTFAVLTGAAHHFIEQPYEGAGRGAFERLVPFLRERGLAPQLDDERCARPAAQQG